MMKHKTVNRFARSVILSLTMVSPVFWVSDQVRYILVEVRKMLYAHPKVLGEPLYVRFQGFGDYSLNLEVFAYIGVTATRSRWRSPKI